jgi:hypothetical protein
MMSRCGSGRLWRAAPRSACGKTHSDGPTAHGGHGVREGGGRFAGARERAGPLGGGQGVEEDSDREVQAERTRAAGKTPLEWGVESSSGGVGSRALEATPYPLKLYLRVAAAAVARGGGFTPVAGGRGDLADHGRPPSRHATERCAVGTARQKLNDALSVKPERCAVGPHVGCWCSRQRSSCKAGPAFHDE